MKKYLKTILQLVIGLGIATALLYLTFRDRSLEDLFQSMKEADIFWMLMGAVALFGVFFFRGMRWKLMLDSSGHPADTLNTIASVFICYLVNSATPKLGEVARCSVMLRTDKIPIPASLGTVITERAFDVIVLLAGIGLIFLVEFQRLSDLFSQMFGKIFGGIQNGLGILLIAGLAGVVLTVGAWYVLRLGKSRKGFAGKIYGFVYTMFQAVKSVFFLQKPGWFFFHTFMTWACLILMNYFFILALPDTHDLGIYFAVLILFIGGIGWALPVPAGMGTTHFIVYQLFLAFGLEGSAGQNIGFFSNGATLVFTVLYGVIGWIFFMIVENRIEKNKKIPNPSLNS
ncbi:MAG: lysylphosphatidylglycerol synthase transmembrane domain-containing protein [Bacteroidia bacterium]|nr:lysylphosphatidylglycerol synthase transmembrane domain-containing protein [Bacteroidia bacterium]